jgi:hypothetical protein
MLSAAANQHRRKAKMGEVTGEDRIVDSAFPGFEWKGRDQWILLNVKLQCPTIINRKLLA